MNGFSIAALIYVIPSLALAVISIVFGADVDARHFRRRRYDGARPTEPSASHGVSASEPATTPTLACVESDLFKIVIVERFKRLISR